MNVHLDVSLPNIIFVKLHVSINSWELKLKKTQTFVKDVTIKKFKFGFNWSSGFVEELVSE